MAAETSPAAQPRELTERQRAILPMLADGYSNPAIARALHIGEATVKTHMRELFKRLGARDRTHAVTVAHEMGLLGEPAQFEHRIARGRVVLAGFSATRERAPVDSRFARLYDAMQAALDSQPEER
jgi:DNA-binding CsgD family transcriptional regulator